MNNVTASTFANMNAQFSSHFREWLAQQESDLEELEHALTDSATTDTRLVFLINNSLTHFGEYCSRRLGLACVDPPAFFSPSWCSTFENSLLWMGGCRPSLHIRLVYAESGSITENTLQDYLNGVYGNGMVRGLTSLQMRQLSALQRSTIKEEEKLDSRMASLQESVADKPMLMLAMRGEEGTSNGNGMDTRVRVAMEGFADGLIDLMKDADVLRMETVRKLATELLTPRQAAEFLTAGKKLHLMVHDWGKGRDRERGRA